MKYLIVTLALAATGLWAYNLGTLAPATQNTNTVLKGHYEEAQCDDIIRYNDGRLVCEVNMHAEDDNLKIFRG